MNILKKMSTLVLLLLLITGCNKEGVYQIVVVGTYGRQYHCKNGDFKALVRED